MFFIIIFYFTWSWSFSSNYLTDHSEQIRVINRSFFLVSIFQPRAIEYSCNDQAKVSSKGVDDHGGSDIVSLGEKQ